MALKKNLRTTFRLSAQHWALFLSIALIDALFFIAYGFFSAPLTSQLAKQATQLADNIAATGLTNILGQLSQPANLPHTQHILFLLIALLIVAYLTYTLFQGTSWWVAAKIAKKKQAYTNYLARFAVLNLLWIALFAAYRGLDILAQMRHVIIQQLIPTAPNLPSILLHALFFIIAVAAVESYATLKFFAIFTVPFRATLSLAILLALIVLLNLAPIDALTTFLSTLALFLLLAFTKLYTLTCTRTH